MVAQRQGCRQCRMVAMIIIVMGVSGAGKSTIGRALAEALGCRFIEGDDYHPPANVERMRAGIPLTDADRGPWLDVLAGEIAACKANGEDLVLSCSALKRRYRDRLRAADPQLRFVHPHGSPEAIGRRMADREGHFMPPALLDSQFAALEPPDADEPVLTLSCELSCDDAVAAVRDWLAQKR